MSNNANLVVQYANALEASDDETVDKLSMHLLGQLMKLGEEVEDEHVARLLEVLGSDSDNEWIREMSLLGPIHTPLDTFVVNTDESGFEEQL